MKPTMLLVGPVLLCWFVAAQSYAPVGSVTSSPDPVFEVESFKQTYLPYEPMSFTFRLRNRTGEPIEIEPPRFVEQATLRITNPKLKTTEVTSLSLSTGGGPQLPGSSMALKPGEKYEEELIPSIHPSFFSKPGIYQVRFALGSLESNSLDLVIDEPRGRDREAYEFVKERGKDVRFAETFFDGSDAKSLKLFVEQFGDSAYGQFAIQSLARYYVFKGEFQKARAEFDKIKESPLKQIRRQTKTDLSEIDKKEADFLRQKTEP